MSLTNYNRLNLALTAFANEYFKNRYKFIYEVDIQVLLSQVLDAHFNEPHIIEKQQKKGEGLKEKEFDIGKVHREYPVNVLFDNVVLGEPKQLDEVIGEIGFTPGFEAFYHQPVKYAIELKFVPLYQSGVKNTDNSFHDYERMLGKISKIENKERKYFNELEYAIQLTVFQSEFEQKEFLENHNKEKIKLNHPNKKDWLNWVDNFKSLINNNKDKAGYYYLDIEEREIMPVPVG